LDQAQTSAAPGLAGYPPTPRDANLVSPLEFQGGKGGLISLLDNLKTRLCIEKAKPSTVAAAIPGPSPSFLATQNGKEPVTMYGRRLGRPNGDVILINALILALAARNDKSPKLSP
jgi:hypothetical protein